ncbi:MAG: hypothetical protein JWN08_2299 [Frankiales bacterium]|jgi:hypothetical protein|nr:hypothetical protein [Frankiales bacterium]
MPPWVTAAGRRPLEVEVAVPDDETYNPWSVVHLVFHHLVDEGLHPVLGSTGDPGAPAAALLRALGVQPSFEGNRQVSRDVKDELASLRAAVLEE